MLVLLILFVKHEDMLIEFNLQPCHYENEMLADITDLHTLGAEMRIE